MVDVAEEIEYASDQVDVTTEDKQGNDHVTVFAAEVEHGAMNKAEFIPNNVFTITDVLRTWALTEINVPKVSVSRLLSSLHPFHNELPKSFYALLPRPQLSFQCMQEGQYVHFPNWTKSFKDILVHNYYNVASVIEYYLLINID